MIRNQVSLKCFAFVKNQFLVICAKCLSPQHCGRNVSHCKVKVHILKIYESIYILSVDRNVTTIFKVGMKHAPLS